MRPRETHTASIIPLSFQVGYNKECLRNARIWHVRCGQMRISRLHGLMRAYWYCSVELHNCHLGVTQARRSSSPIRNVHHICVGLQLCSIAACPCVAHSALFNVSLPYNNITSYPMLQPLTLLLSTYVCLTIVLRTSPRRFYLTIAIMPPRRVARHREQKHQQKQVPPRVPGLVHDPEVAPKSMEVDRW